jgi:hypothetical protein
MNAIIHYSILVSKSLIASVNVCLLLFPLQYVRVSRYRFEKVSEFSNAQGFLQAGATYSFDE